MVRAFQIFTKYSAQWGAFPDFELRRTRIRDIEIANCEVNECEYGVLLEGDKLLPPKGIRVHNLSIGKATRALSEIRDCIDVSIDGLKLGGASGLNPNVAPAKPQ